MAIQPGGRGAGMAAEDTETERLFRLAASHMSHASNSSVSTEDQLRLYALFKQATVGDCNVPRPGMLDFMGKAKWDEWNSHRGMGQAEAMLGYVQATTQLSPDWLDSQPEAEEGSGASPGGTDGGGGGSTGLGLAVSTMAASLGDDSAWGASEAIFKAVSDGDIPALDQAVQAGAHVDMRDGEGRTPLHFAADRGQAAALKRLLELGATVDARDAEGQTALAYAVMCQYEDVVRALVRAGADPNTADDSGDTPLSLAGEEVREALAAP